MPRSAAVFCFFAIALLFPACNQRQEAVNPEIQVEVERIAASKAKTPQDIQPYDEALAWHEYRVKRVLSGKLEADTIRVAHWTVVAAKPVSVSAKPGEVVTLKIVPFESLKGLEDVATSDDLDFATERPRFLDLSQSLAQATPPGAIRFDYRGNVSDQMRLYWKLRGQLRAVAMGNSQATKGVNCRVIMGDGNDATPVMLNMAPAGSNNEQQCLMLREYVLPLPKLEWLLWAVSARSFNAHRKDSRKLQEFTASPGWLHDQKHKKEFWPMPENTPLVGIDELRKIKGLQLDLTGSLITAKTSLPSDPGEQRKFVFKECDSTRFRWSDEIFGAFSDTARAFTARGVKVLVFTTPMHPFTRDAEASDPDGTTHEGFREMVRHMEELARKSPGLWFRDFHKDGDHGYPPAEFYDVDHVNEAGSIRLGESIREWMKACKSEGQSREADVR